MCKLMSVLCFSFLVLSQLYAQGILEVKFVDILNQPVEGVLLWPSNNQLPIKSDTSGICRFEQQKPGFKEFSYQLGYLSDSLTLYFTGRDTQVVLLKDKSVALDEVLVRSYQMTTNHFSNVSTITAEKISENYLLQDLPYALLEAPGVIVQSDAGNGVGYSGIRFRGLDPSHIQVTLNGIPFTDAESSLSYFVDIPDILSNVENVRVYRGNVPNRPGTPSFGGAIDLQTNQIKMHAGGWATIQLGSFNTYKISGLGNSGILKNGLFFETGLSHQESDGYIDRANSKLQSIYLSTGWVGQKSSVRLNYILGSERTGQAWFGLPVQYSLIPSLRTYNVAGTSKPGEPYEHEVDDYQQHHFQLFYQNALSHRLAWSSSFNFTNGRGFYENYIASAFLSSYGLKGNQTIADLTRRKWLDNQYFYLQSSLEYHMAPRWTLQPSFGVSYYAGRHFGRVNQVWSDSIDFIADPYYDNTVIKKEGSLCLKISYIETNGWRAGLDLQYRTVDYQIRGILEQGQPFNKSIQHHFVLPKLFVEYQAANHIQFFSSLGYMQREPFREDLLSGNEDISAENLLDIELGVKGSVSSSLNYSINAFFMHYPRLRGLSGSLNDVGEPLFLQLKNVINTGIEWSSYGTLWDVFEWKIQGSWNHNRIPEWLESVNVYEADWSLSEKSYIRHKNAPLAYAPELVIFNEISKSFKIKILGNSLWKIYFQNQYVSDYFLDNTGNPYSAMKGYTIWHAGLFFPVRTGKHHALDCWLKIQNLFNANYFSHGWIARSAYKGTLDLTLDPYTGLENSPYYHYKGLYPQALRQVSAGIRLKFN